MLLERLGLHFRCVAPDCDESQYGDLPPEELATTLAVAKAESLAGEPGLIIGSDQVVDLGGEILGKPGDRDRAIAQLMAMSGRPHRLITAVAVHESATGRTELAMDIHTLRMRSLSVDTLTRYVDYEQPFDCAGSYKLEGRGIALFDRIEADPDTADSNAVVGLPITKLLNLLRRFGFEVLDL